MSSFRPYPVSASKDSLTSRIHSVSRSLRMIESREPRRTTPKRPSPSVSSPPASSCPRPLCPRDGTGSPAPSTTPERWTRARTPQRRGSRSPSPRLSLSVQRRRQGKRASKSLDASATSCHPRWNNRPLFLVAALSRTPVRIRQRATG